MVAINRQPQRAQGRGTDLIARVSEASRYRLTGPQDPNLYYYIQRMTAVVMARFPSSEQVAFGAELYLHQNGFLALETITWANPTQTRGWPETQGILKGFLEIGLIEEI